MMNSQMNDNCPDCNPSDQGTRHAHLLSYEAYDAFVDHIKRTGVKDHNIGAMVDWWRTMREMYKGMRDESGSPLTVQQAWQQSQSWARARQYSTPSENAAHRVREEYWQGKDQMVSEQDVAAQALRLVRGIINGR